MQFFPYLFFFFSSIAFGQTQIRVEIEDIQLELIDGNTIPFKIYSVENGLTKTSQIFIWSEGETIDLKVVNLTSEDHGFKIDGQVDYGTIIPGDSVIQTINLSEGVYRYYDPVNVQENTYLGLSGIIHVKASTDLTDYFYWDIREHQSDLNASIISGGNFQSDLFTPDYFTINGNSNPEINADTLARVEGAEQIEFKIIIVNNGKSIHSMHFHGYHLAIVHSALKPETIGREKDTFPISPEEVLVLSCTPDKPGEYPVHDHNLVAVTGGSVYGAGMFTTLLIQP